jgi:hypothetical protein
MEAPDVYASDVFSFVESAQAKRAHDTRYLAGLPLGRDRVPPSQKRLRTVEIRGRTVRRLR